MLEQCLRSTVHLSLTCDLVGLILDNKAELVNSNNFTMLGAAKPEDVRHLPQEFLRATIDGFDRECLKMIVPDPETPEQYCAFVPIRINNLLVGMAVVYEKSKSVPSPKKHITMERICFLIRQLVELALLQAGSNLDDITWNAEDKENVTEPMLTVNDFPTLKTLLGPNAFTERVRLILLEGGPERLLAVTIFKVEAFADNTPVVQNDLRLELFDNILSRLAGNIRDGDDLAYMSDDIFAMIVSPIPTATLVTPIFNRIIGAMSQPIVRNRQLYQVTVNAGIDLLKSNLAVRREDIVESISRCRLRLDESTKEGPNKWIVGGVE